MTWRPPRESLLSVLLAILMLSATVTPVLGHDGSSAAPHQSESPLERIDDLPPATGLEVFASANQSPPRQHRQAAVSAAQRLSGPDVSTDINQSQSAYLDDTRVATRQLFTRDADVLWTLYGSDDLSPTLVATIREQLLTADAATANASVTDARRLLQETDRIDSTSREIAQDRLEAAETAYQSAQRYLATNETDDLEAAAAAVRQYGKAWRYSQQALDRLDEAVDPRISLTRRDPIRNGFTTTELRITGIVSDIRTRTLDEVTLRVRGESTTVDAEVSRSMVPGKNASFAATVPVSDRTATIDVTAVSRADFTRTDTCADGLCVDQIVHTNSELAIHTGPSLDEEVIETLDPERSGTIVDGPVRTPTTTFFKVDYGDVTGWSAAAYLTRGYCGAFCHDEIVSPVEETVIREEPGANATAVGTVSDLLTGTVVAGPQDADGATWWKVVYGTGVTGWTPQSAIDESTLPENTAQALAGEERPDGEFSTQSVTRPGENETAGVVRQTDLATLRLDGDGLPDEIETRAGSDPLYPDSDFPGTAPDEGDDGILDGQADGDEDGLLTARELLVGTDPENADTDGDGLEDGVELRTGQLDPTTADTDGDGTPDGEADPDGDGLTNTEEQAAGTRLTAADSDRDGLNDRTEVELLDSDPTQADTDSDGLDDQTEQELETDPTVADTDDDGVADPNETYTTTTSDPATNVSVEVTGVGAAADRLALAPAAFGNDSNTSSLFEGPVVELASEGDRPIEEFTVDVPLDEPGAAQQNLTVVQWNGSANDSWTPLPTTRDGAAVTATLIDGTALANTSQYVTVVALDTLRERFSARPEPALAFADIVLGQGPESQSQVRRQAVSADGAETNDTIPTYCIGDCSVSTDETFSVSERDGTASTDDVDSRKRRATAEVVRPRRIARPPGGGGGGGDDGDDGGAGCDAVIPPGGGGGGGGCGDDGGGSSGGDDGGDSGGGSDDGDDDGGYDGGGGDDGDDGGYDGGGGDDDDDGGHDGGGGDDDDDDSGYGGGGGDDDDGGNDDSGDDDGGDAGCNAVARDPNGGGCGGDDGGGDGGDDGGVGCDANTIPPGAGGGGDGDDGCGGDDGDNGDVGCDANTIPPGAGGGGSDGDDGCGGNDGGSGDDGGDNGGDVGCEQIIVPPGAGGGGDDDKGGGSSGDGGSGCGGDDDDSGGSGGDGDDDTGSGGDDGSGDSSGQALPPCEGDTLTQGADGDLACWPREDSDDGTAEEQPLETAIAWTVTVPETEGWAGLFSDLTVTPEQGEPNPEATLTVSPTDSPAATTIRFPLSAGGDGIQRELIDNPLEISQYAGEEVTVLISTRDARVDGTLPVVYADSDQDGIYDAVEQQEWTLPTGKMFSTDADRADTDNDGLGDDEEVSYDISGTVGSQPIFELAAARSDPTLEDSDSDGLSDVAESQLDGVDPLDPDSDGDGIIDSEDPEPTTPQASEEPIWELSFGSIAGGSAKISRRAVLGALLGEAGVEYSGTIRSALSAGVRSQQLKQYLLGKGGYSLAEFWELTSSDTTIPFEESDTESLAYVAGWIMAGFVPVAGALADVRDCLVLTDSTSGNALDCGFAAVSVVLSAGTIAGALAGGPAAPALAGGAVLADTAQSVTKAIKITAKAIKKGLVRPDRIVRWVYHNVKTSVLKQVNFAQEVASELGGRASRLVKESADDAKAQQRLVADGGLNEKLARAITKADVSDELAIIIKTRISNFDEIGGLYIKTRLIERISELDEPITAAERLSDLDSKTLRQLTDKGWIDATDRLIERGTSPKRLSNLVDEGIDIATHNKIIEILSNRASVRAVRGADDTMEALATIRLRKSIKPSESMKEEVEIFTENGNNIEIDSAVVNADGEIISIGQVKLSNSKNAYFESVGQLGENWQYIVEARGKITEISTASGQIPPSKLDPSNVDKGYTIAQKGGNGELPREIPEVHTKDLPDPNKFEVQNRRSYTYTVPYTKNEIQEAYLTFKNIRDQ